MADRDLVRLCALHRRVLNAVEVAEGESLVCPAGRSHLAVDQNGKPLWEVWLREPSGRLVARVYTVRRGRAVPEDWYVEMSRNYAAELAGRDPDGFTPEARLSDRASRGGRPLTQSARVALEKARQTQAAAEGRRQRLLATVSALGVAVACVLGAPARSWCQSHTERVEDPAVVPFDGNPSPPPCATPTPPPPSEVQKAHAEPASVVLDMGTQVVAAGEDARETSDVQPYGSLQAETPVALWGTSPWLRAGVDVDLAAAPGDSIDFRAVESFSAVYVGLNGRRILGVGTFKGQTIETALACEWAFGWRRDLPDAVPDERSAKRYGCGLDVRERASRASVRLLYGLDDVVGDRGFGHVLVRLRLPVPATDGIVALGVKASIGLGSGTGQFAGVVRQHDYRSVLLTIDGAQALRSIRGKGKAKK